MFSRAGRSPALQEGWDIALSSVGLAVTAPSRKLMVYSIQVCTDLFGPQFVFDKLFALQVRMPCICPCDPFARLLLLTQWVTLNGTAGPL